MKTSLEVLRDLGKATGLVSTTHITHATPACFGAHSTNRDRYSEIVSDLLYNSRPNVMFAGGGEGICESEARNAGYTVVTDAAGLQRLTGSARGGARGGARARGGMRAGGLFGGARSGARYSGQFGTGNMPYELDGVGSLPHLSDMTAAALEILDDDPEGFFLMVEGGRIDHACHSNLNEQMVLETVEFSNAVQKALDWAADRDDTLMIVTADHECGGLTVVADNGKGNYPTVTWSSTNHTGVNVPVYALGPNAEMVTGVIDNTDIFTICTAGAEAAVEEATAASAP
jgi:alkaline phosphatase